MDFSSLGQGSPFYILRQGEKPILEVGTVKDTAARKVPNANAKPYGWLADTTGY